MSENFYVRVEPTICKYCPEEHPAVAVQFGSVYVVMPTDQAQRFANELYEASLQATKLNETKTA